jgi:hypothetical protein
MLDPSHDRRKDYRMARTESNVSPHASAAFPATKASPNALPGLCPQCLENLAAKFGFSHITVAFIVSGKELKLYLITEIAPRRTRPERS